MAETVSNGIAVSFLFVLLRVIFVDRPVTLRRKNCSEPLD